tara:strand:- start:1578 stop:1958 length:381 start_codon:yes stop_codon:yes gene_type:complete
MSIGQCLVRQYRVNSITRYEKAILEIDKFGEEFGWIILKRLTTWESNSPLVDGKLKNPACDGDIFELDIKIIAEHYDVIKPMKIFHDFGVSIEPVNEAIIKKTCVCRSKSKQALKLIEEELYGETA